MTDNTPQQRLRDIRDEASTLAAKGLELTPADSEKFEALMTEADGLKSQIGHLERFSDLKGWMDQSAGQLPLAGTPAGETVFETSPGKDGATGIKMLEQYGPGISRNKAFVATTTTEYRAAFKAYIQFGERGLNSEHIKTLQEGQDTEGGFAGAPLAA